MSAFRMLMYLQRLGETFVLILSAQMTARNCVTGWASSNIPNSCRQVELLYITVLWERGPTGLRQSFCEAHLTHFPVSMPLHWQSMPRQQSTERLLAWFETLTCYLKTVSWSRKHNMQLFVCEPCSDRYKKLLDRLMVLGRTWLGHRQTPLVWEIAIGRL